MLEASTPLAFVEAVVDTGHRSAHRIPSVVIVGPGLVGATTANALHCSCPGSPMSTDSIRRTVAAVTVLGILATLMAPTAHPPAMSIDGSAGDGSQESTS